MSCSLRKHVDVCGCKISRCIQIYLVLLRLVFCNLHGKPVRSLANQRNFLPLHYPDIHLSDAYGSAGGCCAVDAGNHSMHRYCRSECTITPCTRPRRQMTMVSAFCTRPVLFLVCMAQPMIWRENKSRFSAR